MRNRRRQYQARSLLDDLDRERSALADLTRTLEQRVQDRTGELLREAAQRSQIEEQLRQAQKMESLGQLTGGVAHDFNNLLMAVMGNLELLRKRVPDDPRLHRLIDSALQGAKRGASLTQRLLAFARQQDLRPVSTDLVSLIHDMTDLLERSLGPQIQLHLTHPEDLPPALVDPNQFELALLNLAINARDAMPEGGAIHIEVTTTNDAGRPELKPGRYLRVTVSDTGSGMDAQTLARAAEPFFSTKPVGRGTGLGLSMVHGLMVQLGGLVDISSERGSGTKVDLWIPVAVTAPKVVPESVDVPVLERGSTVLLVDDDPLIATSAVDMLEDIGHTVIEVNSGQDALEILRSDQPIDILVTDHSMPGMTGVELARATREIRPDIPILLVTGFADLTEDQSLRLPASRQTLQTGSVAHRNRPPAHRFTRSGRGLTRRKRAGGALRRGSADRCAGGRSAVEDAASSSMTDRQTRVPPIESCNTGILRIIGFISHETGAPFPPGDVDHIFRLPAQAGYGDKRTT